MIRTNKFIFINESVHTDQKVQGLRAVLLVFFLERDFSVNG